MSDFNAVNKYNVQFTYSLYTVHSHPTSIYYLALGEQKKIIKYISTRAGFEPTITNEQHVRTERKNSSAAP